MDNNFVDKILAANSAKFIADYGLDIFKVVKQALLLEDRLCLDYLRAIRDGVKTVDQVIEELEIAVGKIELDMLEQTSGDMDVLDVSL